MLSFMIESLLLALMAGLVGCVVSLSLNYVTTGIGNFATFSEIQFRFHVGLTTAVGGVTFALLLGLAGGYFPARSGSRKEILVALREN